MGQTEINSALINVSKASLNNFNIQEKIGRGGFSKVYKAEFIKTGHNVAIKQMNKLKLIQKQMTMNILKEKQILSTIYHPFIVNMYATFQDVDNVYIVMDYCSCGDFRSQLQYMKDITEEQIKFFAGCIILGLEYIHSKGIIHRDLKPENIICDDKGFLRISDFGIAKSINETDEKSLGKYEICGTPGFISPEIIQGKTIGYESDYFSFGVMLYEIVMGKKPYTFSSKNDITYEKVILTQQETGNNYSKELCDFISKLIEIDPKKRLGRNGVIEIKSHPFFDDFNWKQLFYKTIKIPYTPQYRLRKRNSTPKQVKLQKKSTCSKDSKETNDSDESIHNSFPEFNDFDFLRTPKINCYTAFYNSNLIQYNSNYHNSKSNIKLTKNSQKHISLISPKKNIYKLMLNKHSLSKNIQPYNKKNQSHNNSFNKLIRACSVSKINNCNLPTISQGKHSFTKKPSQNKLIDIPRSECKPKTTLSNKRNINIVKTERFNSVIKNFKQTNNNDAQIALFRKLNYKKKSYIYKGEVKLNLSSFIIDEC